MESPVFPIISFIRLSLAAKSSTGRLLYFWQIKSLAGVEESQLTYTILFGNNFSIVSIASLSSPFLGGSTTMRLVFFLFILMETDFKSLPSVAHKFSMSLSPCDRFITSSAFCLSSFEKSIHPNCILSFFSAYYASISIFHLPFRFPFSRAIKPFSCISTVHLLIVLSDFPTRSDICF